MSNFFKKKYVVNTRFATQKTTGVQRFAYECSVNISEIIGENVEFVAPKGGIDKQLKSSLNIKQFGFFRGHLWEQIDLPLYCLYKKSILVAFCGLPPIFYKKTIYTIHDLAYIRYPQFFNTLYRLIYSIVIKIAYKNILSINTVSNFTKDEVIDVLGYRKINVVNNSINHMFDKNNNSELPEILKGKKYILAVGSLDPRKNIDSLINAFVKEELDYFLVIVGEKNKVFSKNESLFQANNKKIIFTGYLEDSELRACYQNTECFFYPSLYEGFGIPPLEAIFYNVPIAISNIPPHIEIFDRYAVFYDPRKIEYINSTIEMSKNLLKKYKDDGINSNHPLIKKFSKQNQKNQLKKIILMIEEAQ